MRCDTALTVIVVALLTGGVLTGAVRDDDEYPTDSAGGAIGPQLQQPSLEHAAPGRPQHALYDVEQAINGADNKLPAYGDSRSRHSVTPTELRSRILLQAPSTDVQQACCHNGTLIGGYDVQTWQCAAVSGTKCYRRFKGNILDGKCGDTPNPCDWGACCEDVESGMCGHTWRGGCRKVKLGGDNSVKIVAPWFKDESCTQSCRSLSLGACCMKASPSSPATCIMGKTLQECAIDPATQTTSMSFLGFRWNATCADVDCNSYGACCSSDRQFYDSGDFSIKWGCAAGYPDPAKCNFEPGDGMGEFVQGYTCPDAKTGCNDHVGACCYLNGAQRLCADGLRRIECSQKPSFVGFQAGASCESIGSCAKTELGACLSPPRPTDTDPGNPFRNIWPCIAGDSEAVCNARQLANNGVSPTFWFPQHAPGYSCYGFDITGLGFNNTGMPANISTIWGQRGACRVFHNNARRCYNNRTRSVCVSSAGFLGFNAGKACNQTSTVVYGACCHPPLQWGRPTKATAKQPFCMATTELACSSLNPMTAWVKDKPCTNRAALKPCPGCPPETCTQDIRGACCYSRNDLRREGPYTYSSYSTQCVAGVSWKTCYAPDKNTTSADFFPFKFVAGSTCAVGTCPQLSDPGHDIQP